MTETTPRSKSFVDVYCPTCLLHFKLDVIVLVCPTCKTHTILVEQRVI